MSEFKENYDDDEESDFHNDSDEESTVSMNPKNEEGEEEDDGVNEGDNEGDNEGVNEEIECVVNEINEDDNDASDIDEESSVDFNDAEDSDNESLEKEKGRNVKKSSPIFQKTNEEYNGSDIDSDDEEEDDNYLQKFDSDINKSYINNVHPECIINNYDEIAILTIVKRDADNIIVDPLHKTLPYLTKYEKARILGQRAKQIISGAKPFIKVPENIIDGYLIAELELMQKRVPFIIRRPLPGGTCEYWNIKDLEMLDC